MIGEFVLRAISRPLDSGDYIRAVEPKGLDGALSALEREFPDLPNLVTNKRVLDFGCGTGRQSVSLAKRYGSEVYGLDINDRWLSAAEQRAAEHLLKRDKVQFGKSPSGESFDTVITVNAMEHFSDPVGVLQQMTNYLRPGGKILLTFSPPWLSPFGHHMHFFCRLPWLHLIFPERTVMKVRASYRSDGATTYADAGLNKMTLARFRKIVDSSGLDVVCIRYNGVKGVSAFTQIPIIRELLTNRVTAILRRPEPVFAN